MKRKKRTIAIIIAEIICLVAAAGIAFKLHSDRLEKQREAERQQELARQQEEQRQKEKEQEAQERIAELESWNLMLVNNQYAIPDDYDPEIAEIESGYSVDARIKEPLKKMLSDCREAGHSPRVISAYRSHETQQYLYDTTANKSDTAVPGHSEHECGLAVDIVDADSLGWGDPLIEKQETMEAQKWLMANCQNYGFIMRYPKDKEDITEIIYEPWHYRYVGKEHAAKIMERGICLEEYVNELRNS